MFAAKYIFRSSRAATVHWRRLVTNDGCLVSRVHSHSTVACVSCASGLHLTKMRWFIGVIQGRTCYMSGAPQSIRTTRTRYALFGLSTFFMTFQINTQRNAIRFLSQFKIDSKVNFHKKLRLIEHCDWNGHGNVTVFRSWWFTPALTKKDNGKVLRCSLGYRLLLGPLITCQHPFPVG